MRIARIIIALLIGTPLLVSVSGCAGFRLPAIDPTGRSIFLPNPNFTTLAGDGPLGRLLHHGQNGATGTPLPGPYQPALLNKHRQHMGNMLGGLGRLSQHLHDDLKGKLGRLHHGRAPAFGPSTYGNSANAFGGPPNGPAFTTPSAPPLCGPDGNAPDGSPCYPIGSPSASSRSASIPGLANRLGQADPATQSNQGFATGNCNTCGPNQATTIPQSNGIQTPRFAQLGPRVVMARPTILAPVGQEIIVLGGVQTGSGVFRPNEPVQWTLSNNSVGTIVNSASYRNTRRRGLFGFLHSAPPPSSLGGCGNCVHSVTAARCDVLTLNPVDPTDDVYVSRGQSWVRMTSGSEGASYVTLSAPKLECGGRRAATTQVIWVDARWECPRPVISSFEDPEGAQLVTRVTRQTDNSPLEDWTVRYRYIDGPEVRFDETGATRVDVAADSRGRAVVNVKPQGGETGSTRIGIQFINPRINNGEPVGQCVSYVTWSEQGTGPPTQIPSELPSPSDVRPALPRATEPPIIQEPADDVPLPSTQPGQFPDRFDTIPIPSQGSTVDSRTNLAITVKGPETANPGDLVNYQTTVRNIGNVAAENVIVSTSLPADGVQFRGSDQQFQQVGNDVLWPIGNLQPNEQRVVNTQFQIPATLGRLRNLFFAEAKNAGEVNNDAFTEVVAANPITIRTSDPIPFSPEVGQPVKIDVEVTNNTNRPVDVVLANLFALNGRQETEPAVSQPITIPGGQTIRRTLDFTPGQAGTFQYVVRDTQSGAEDTGFLKVNPRTTPLGPGTTQPPLTQPPATQSQSGVSPLDLESKGNPFRAGSKERYEFLVRHVGNLPLKNVQIQYISDENVRLVNSGNPPGQASDGGSVLTWVAPQMNPGDALLITLDLEAAPQPTSNKVEHQIRIDTDRGSDSYNVELDIIDGPAANGNFGAGPPAGNGGFGGASPVDPAAPTAAGTLAAKVQAPQAVAVSETIDYVLTVKNNNINSFRDIGVTMQIAEQMEFISTSAPPGIQTRSSPDGLIMEFAPLRELPSGQDIVYRAKARAMVAGTARFLGSVNAIGVKQLIVGAETKVN